MFSIFPLILVVLLPPSIAQESREEYRTRLAALDSDDADGHHDLGVWCRENGLARKAKARFRRAIKIDPEHAAAHEALGHVQVEGEWVPPDKVEQARMGWDFKAIHETKHFRIYYAGRKSLAEELGVFGEALVATFRETFADCGELPGTVTPEDPLRVFVFKKKAAYAAYTKRRVPTMSGNLFPKYDPGSRTAYMAEEGSTKNFLIQSFVHEATHALAGHAMWAGGSWLSEGWADYMALSVDFKRKTLEPGRVTQTKKSKHASLVKLLVKRGEALPMADVIAMDRVRFGRNATKAYAQSWSIFYFLRHYGQGVYREGLVKYIRGTLQGKAGREAFEEAVGPLDEISREWKDYVRRIPTD